MLELNQNKICKICVLPNSPPHIFLDEEGVCNICRNHQRANKEVTDNVGAAGLESDFLKIINKNKGKGKYDCLVMCSGGKDSTSSLYYMKKRYKLNPLAFTFDHGFETEDALENIHNAVDRLGVDFLFFKSFYMHKMFADILKNHPKVVICHLCSIWYMQLSYDIAARYEIPLIVAGWTKGQSIRQPVMTKCACNIDAPEFLEMGEATKKFLQEYVKTEPAYADFPGSMEDVQTRAKKRYKCLVVSPHWFLPFDQQTYVETITRELNWKYPRISYPGRSTNCYLNFVSVYNSMKFYGYTHYHVEMSKLIRDGLLTREDALRDLEINFDKDFLNTITKKIDYEFT